MQTDNYRYYDDEHPNVRTDKDTLDPREKLAQFCDKTIVTASDNCACGLPKSQHPAPALTDAQRLAFMTDECDQLRSATYKANKRAQANAAQRDLLLAASHGVIASWANDDLAAAVNRLRLVYNDINDEVTGRLAK